MSNYTKDHLLNQRVQIFQPVDGYRASTDAVVLSSIIRKVKDQDTILDVGSGTGGVSLCLAYHFPNCRITGLELQEDLAALSKQSAEENGFSNLTYHQCDIRNKKLPVEPCSFDHVITNPPYYEKISVSPNQSKALAHMHQNFNLQGWLKFCLKMLKPFGYLYLINRVETLPVIMNTLFGHAGDIQILPYFSKPEQDAKRILLIARKDSKAPLKILPPFYMHTPDGQHTDQAEKILRDAKLFFED